MAKKDQDQAIPKAHKPKKMTELELATICFQEFDESQTLTVDIQDERESALNYYNQMPFGNEEDGLSKYVSSDVRDVVEWTLPQLIDIFVGGDTPIIFEPENADDVKDAETESRYCQYVFERQNKGVILTAGWFKDALLQKNGIVKAWWQKSVSKEREEYVGKTSAEWLALDNDDEFEITECTITVADVEYSKEEYTAILQALPTMRETIDAEAHYHIIGYRKKNVSSIKIENVPPENFFVQKDHNSIFLKDASYCGEFYEKTRSELLEMGYDYDLIMALPASTGMAESRSNEAQARRQKEGGVTFAQSVNGVDRSREKVMIYDHYIRADYNNDGVAELRLVRTADKNSLYVLENEEVDRNIYHALTPYLNSFRFFGRSLADNVMDVQRSKSQLLRNAFDNVAYSAIPRKIVKGNVDIGALMTYVPGGIIKADINSSVENEQTQFVADSALLMADRMDAIRSERSGFSKETMGLNPEALANSTNVVGMSIMAQSQLLVKMIATIFAHSGFQSLMEHVRELVLKYESGNKIFDLTGNFMETDMRRWRKQRSSTVRVGIGYAGKNEEISMMDRMMGLQEKFILAQGGSIDGPLTNAQGIFNTTQRMCRRIGIKDASTYFTDPSTYQPPPPKPTIAEQTLNAQVQNMQNQQTIQEAKMATDLDQQKFDHEYKMAELAQKERLAIQEMKSKEKMQEMELLYKYGKDARDRHEVSPKEAKFDDKSIGSPPDDKKIHSDLSELKKNQQEINKSVSSLAGDHRELSKGVIKALTNKKKAKITNGPDGKTIEIE